MAQKDISEISISDATLSDENARLYLRWIESGTHNYIEYNKENTENIRALTNLFINNHAMVDLRIVPLYTYTPLHVFRVNSHKEFAKVEGLIYTNGVVSIYDDITIRLWIQQDTVRLFEYPRPDYPPSMPQ